MFLAGADANDIVVASYDHCAYADAVSRSDPVCDDLVVLVLFAVLLILEIVLSYEMSAWGVWSWVNAPPARLAQ
jgi:hypothetical protein